MLKTALAGVRAHSRRFAGTVLAVILGVGFVTGTLIFGDTVQEGYFEAFARAASNADAVVVSPSAEDVARIRAVSDVDEMDVRFATSLPMLDRKGRPITNFGQIGVAVPADGPADLRQFDLDGRAPAPGGREALLDKETAAQQRLAIGDELVVVDPQSKRIAYKITGLMDFGVAKAVSGLSVVGLPAAEIEALTGATAPEQVVVSARSGVDEERLAAALRAAVRGDGATVLTGEKWRTNLADSATSVASQLTFALLIFGGISLVVAAFVIYNTFAILLAQRIRETALLRCVGASRRQVLGALLLEAIIVGLAGSVAGLVAGIGVAYALPVVFGAVENNSIPMQDVVLAPASLLIGLVVGLVATVLAALLPALRATRVPPMAALRTLPAALPGRRRLPRALLALVVGGLGTAVTVLGWKFGDSQTGTIGIIAGGMIVFLAVLIASPLFVGGLTAAVGAPFRPFAGATLRLAVANSRRNPGRSAVTAAALMIGIALMALFSVLISSVKTTADEQIAAHYPVDYVISGLDYGAARPATGGSDAGGSDAGGSDAGDGGQPGEGQPGGGQPGGGQPGGGPPGGVPRALAAQLRTHPEFTAVIETRVVPAGLRGGEPVVLGAMSDRAGQGVVLSRKQPWAKTVRAGDTVMVVSGGKEFPLTVTGFAESTTIPAAGSIDLLVPWEQLQDMAGAGNNTTVMVKARSDVSVVASHDILESYREQYPLLEIGSIADMSDDLETQIAGLIGLFGGLLAMTVLIALFGIANTLSLSVVERTRESATMRAMGLTRGQLRGTLLYEAVLLGIVSGIVGVGFGVLFGRIVVLKALSGMGPTVTVPWSWLLGLLGLAAAASVVAGVLPARRAAGASVVAAMAEDV